MSSSNKTELGLNLWLGGDKPKREDFCNDNLIIDKQITEHKNDVLYQLTESPQEDEQIYVGAYLLLDSPVAATVHFSKLSLEEQSTFLGFPISHFMPNNH